MSTSQVMRCPQCGAPGDGAACRFCGAKMTSAIVRERVDAALRADRNHNGIPDALEQSSRYLVIPVTPSATAPSRRSTAPAWVGWAIGFLPIVLIASLLLWMSWLQKSRQSDDARRLVVASQAAFPRGKVLSGPLLVDGGRAFLLTTALSEATAAPSRSSKGGRALPAMQMTGLIDSATMRPRWQKATYGSGAATSASCTDGHIAWLGGDDLFDLTTGATTQGARPAGCASPVYIGDESGCADQPASTTCEGEGGHAFKELVSELSLTEGGVTTSFARVGAWPMEKAVVLAKGKVEVARARLVGLVDVSLTKARIVDDVAIGAYRKRDDSSEVVAIDRRKGTVLWRHAINGIVEKLDGGDGRVFVRTNALQVLDARTGSVLLDVQAR